MLGTLITNHSHVFGTPPKPPQNTCTSYHLSHATRPGGLARRRASPAARFLLLSIRKSRPSNLHSNRQSSPPIPATGGDLPKVCRSVEPNKAYWTLQLSHLESRHVNLQVLVMDPPPTALAAILGPPGFPFVKAPSRHPPPKTQPAWDPALRLVCLDPASWCLFATAGQTCYHIPPCAVGAVAREARSPPQKTGRSQPMRVPHTYRTSIGRRQVVTIPDAIDEPTNVAS